MTDVDAAPAPPSRKRAFAIAGGLLIAGFGIPLLGVIFAMRSCSRPVMSGRLELAGTALGSYRATLDRCRSTVSPDEIELGTATSPLLVRVTFDPLDGPILLVHTLAADRTLTIATRTCPNFIARLTRTSSADDATPTYDGEVTGTCPLPAGGTVTISSWFRSCGA